MVDDFPLRPDGRIPRAAKSPPSAVLRLTLRPARSSRVLACLARLLVSRTPRDRRHEPKARGETERRNGYPTIAAAPGVGRTPSPNSLSCKRSMPIGSKRCRPTNTTARWPRPSRLSANSISPNSRAWRPHAASDATDLSATNAQDKPTCRSERFPDAWPQHRRYTPRPRFTAHRYPPRYAPPAARRARRYARVPPMDSGDEPLPMMTTSTLGLDYFWTPIMAYFSAPIDNLVGHWKHTQVTGSERRGAAAGVRVEADEMMG